MRELIEGLTILGQYSTADISPLNCMHDVLMVMGVDFDDPNEAERARLDVLGFFWSDEHDCFISYRFGSA